MATASSGLDRFIVDFNRVYQPYPIQAAFHASPIKHKLLGGAAGPGKTLALLVEHMIACNEFGDPEQAKQVHTLLLRRTNPKLEATVVTRFREKIPRELYKSYHEQKNVVTWHNGATTKFGSMQHEHDAWGYQGQWYKISYDELAEFTFQQWQATSAWNRCPVSPHATKDGASNPIGIGAGWLKRLFVDKKPCEEMDKDQRLTYDPEDYAYFPCTYRDNPVYANDPTFLKNLEAYPAAIRDALKEGKWGVVGGYFTDAWDEAEHVYEQDSVEIKPWWTRWLSADWGFEHWSAIYWHCIDEFGVKRTYHELVVNHQPPETLAESIVKESEIADGGHAVKYDAFYLSHDAFHQKTDQNTIARRMGKILSPEGFPLPVNAGTDKVGREQLMYQLLRNRLPVGSEYRDDVGRAVQIQVPEWQISSQCQKLIEVIPRAPRDEKKIDQIASFAGDDPIAGVGHGLYGKLGKPSPIPKEVQLQGAMQRLVESIKTPNLAHINTMKHLEHLRFDTQWKKDHRPLRKTRNWRGN
jgi:hypothetical protein